MSARKPGTVATTTTTIAGAGAKPDSNNVTSPTAEIEVSLGDESKTGDKETAGEDENETAATSPEAATATDEAIPDTENDKDDDKDQRPLTAECGTPRKTCSDLGLGAAKNLRMTRNSSSPLFLLNSSGGGGGGSDGEEQPSGSQRKSSADRQIFIRGRKSIKELKESRESIAAKQLEELNAKEEALEMASEETNIVVATEQCAKDHKEAKDTKDNVKSALEEKTIDRQDLKDCKEKEKESTPTPILQPTPAMACNRVTRKAHAQELALAINNTRVTRNRRQSSTVNNEPQLPARGRRKKPAPPEPKEPKELLKRKRSDDDSEIGLKYSKIEVKEEDDDHDSSVASLVGDEAAPAKQTLSIKLELPDSEDQIPIADLPSPAATVTPTQQSANRRGRGRPQSKVTPSSSTTITSTRATRHSKAGSPCLLAATPTEPTASKRRRVGSANRGLLVSKATSASSSSLATSSHGGGAGDEDSKDSLASTSMDDLLLAAAEIKQEKLTPDFDESFDAVPKTTETETGEPKGSADNVLASSSSASANGIEPLTVDTATVITEDVVKKKDAVKDTAPEGDRETESNEAGKAPSLSPEMISEGVSAISVKQFYKKPEFLANNLGIEKDPELGEIVQIATDTETPAVDGEVECEPEGDADIDASGTIVELEIEMDGDVEAKQDDSYSTGMGELRVDESGDETDLDTQTAPIEISATDAEETEAMTAATIARSSPGEPNGETEAELQAKRDDYDDFESEIMEQLAKEGVVDASGNALSASKECPEKEQLTEIECETVKAAETLVQEQDEVEQADVKSSHLGFSMEVESFTEDQEAEANAEADDDGDMQILSEDCTREFPEENKENVSTSVGDAIATAVTAVGHDLAMDIDLAIGIKAEDNVEDVKEEPKDQEDEKPLAAVAAEQKVAKNKTKTEANCKLKLKALDACDDELRREKELHLQRLGLLTHQAAEQIRQEYIQEANTRAVHQQQQQQHQQQNHQQCLKRSAGKGGGGSASHIESSGTLKTVIKLNRSSNGGAAGGSGVPTGTVIHGSGNAGSTAPSMGSATRKGGIGGAAGGGGIGAGSSAHGVRRQSLKMTFQKGRARGHGAADRAADHHGAHGAEDSYYTIQNENEDSSHSEGHGGQMDHGFYQMVKKDEKEKILIPEKASSFKFHPGRLCEDQCYYCSGKFGLYDTPCHVGQIKSVERQQKILANEEKLTVDNCLCDACFRHVDRRANAPSYKKRISAPGHLETSSNINAGNNGNGNGNNLDKHFAGDAGDGEFATTSSGAVSGSTVQRVCAVKDCADGASHTLRRKCVRKSVKKCLLNFDIPVGTSSVWLCEPHYNTVIQSSGCVLCKRRLGKNHMYHITAQDTDRLEKALAEMGIPVQLGVGTAVCKLCRYFANLLMKPPDSTKSQKAEFVKNYRKRLLKVHNLQDGSNEASEADEDDLRASTAASTAAASGGAGGALPTPSTAATDGASTELPVVVEYDGPTDSNSSSSSTTPVGHGASSGSTSKQMSKLQAILQQNLSGETAATANGSNSPSSNGKGKADADISNVLRSNPNISMRELFHGEEDLGVHFKVPFGCSSSQRTPEGWTRVQTFLQYDEPTRRLWEELQKPYGNQSSFLRHLILLEKYYRNGDLVLAPHASPNASVYTQTVRQRLNSYDHGHCGGLQGSARAGSPNASSTSCSPRLSAQTTTTAASSAGGSVLANALTTGQSTEQLGASQAEAVIPLVELNDDDDDEDDDDNNGEEEAEEQPNYYSPDLGLDRLRNVSVDKLTKQLSSNAVTIIARPKDKQTGVGAGTGGGGAAGAATAATQSEETLQKVPKDAPPLVFTSAANSRSILKTNLLNKAVEILPLASQQQQLQPNNKPASVSGEKAQKLLDMANKLTSNQNHGHVQHEAPSVALLAVQQPQKQKTVPSAAGITLAPSILQQQQHQQQAAKVTTNVAQLLSTPPELISLQRRRSSGAGGGAGGGASGVVSVGGRRLQLPRAGGSSGGPPSVIMLPDSLSPQERHDSKSWKPTLIPLKEQHKVQIKSPTLFQTADGRRLPAQVQVQSGGKPYLISIIDYNRMCILRREKLMRDQMLKANAKPKPGQAQSQSQSQTQSQPQLQQQSQSYSAGLSGISKLTAAQQTARHQLQQLQQHHKHQQQQQHQQHQLPTLQLGSAGSGLRLARLAPKPMPPLSNPQNASGAGSQSSLPMLANALAVAAAANAAANNNISMDSNSSWLWNNFPDANQYLLNGNSSGASAGIASKLPHLTAKPATATATSGGGAGGGITFTLKQQQQQQQQQKLIDNVIMSKIPKSLTVIPQHMGGSGGGDAAGGAKE